MGESRSKNPAATMPATSRYDWMAWKANRQILGLWGERAWIRTMFWVASGMRTQRPFAHPSSSAGTAKALADRGELVSTSQTTARADSISPASNHTAAAVARSARRVTAGSNR